MGFVLIEELRRDGNEIVGSWQTMTEESRE
jgi:hypothetical protein